MVGKYKLIQLFLLIPLILLLVSCGNKNIINVNDLQGQSSDIDISILYSKGDYGNSLVKMIEKNLLTKKEISYNEELSVNSDMLVSYKILDELSDEYGLNTRSDLFSKYGQPIAYSDMYSCTIFDGWTIEKAEFVILFNEEKKILIIEKTEFDEILLKIIEIKDKVILCTTNNLYNVDLNCFDIKRIDYPKIDAKSRSAGLAIEDVLYNGEQFFFLINFYNLDDYASNTVSHSAIIKCNRVQEALYPFDNVGISIAETKNNIISLNYKEVNGEKQLLLYKFDKSLKPLQSYKIDVPKSIQDDAAFSEYDTISLVGNSIFYTTRSKTSENQYIFEFDFNTLRIKYIGCLKINSEYFIKSIIIQ